MAIAGGGGPVNLVSLGLMESVHDNTVYAYTVSFSDRTVRLHTTFKGSEGTQYTDAVFFGVVTHQFFEMVVGQAILNEIIDAHPMQFYENYRSIFEPETIGGILQSSLLVPFRYHDVGEFMAGLLERGLSCFEVVPSWGMYGFVIGERCELVERDSPYVAA